MRVCGTLLSSEGSVLFTNEESLTCQDSTSDPWDALYLCDVVVAKVFITCGVEVLGITEGPPQFGGDSFIIYFNDLCTDIIPFRNECSIPQEADTGEEASKGVIVTNLHHQIKV